jgi:hypothetical protein
VFISPASIFGSIAPRIKGFALGGNFLFDEKHERALPVPSGLLIISLFLNTSYLKLLGKLAGMSSAQCPCGHL